MKSAKITFFIAENEHYSPKLLYSHKNPVQKILANAIFHFSQLGEWIGLTANILMRKWEYS